MKKLASILFYIWACTFVASPAWAVLPFEPITPQQSASAEGKHVFVGNNLVTLTVTWNAATTARYLMIINGVALPGNGAIASCQASNVTGCLLYCADVTTAGTAPSAQSFDWTVHPVFGNFGIVAALSTGAGCGTLTVDGANDFFYGQVY